MKIDSSSVKDSLGVYTQNPRKVLRWVLSVVVMLAACSVRVQNVKSLHLNDRKATHWPAIDFVTLARQRRATLRLQMVT